MTHQRFFCLRSRLGLYTRRRGWQLTAFCLTLSGSLGLSAQDWAPSSRSLTSRVTASIATLSDTVENKRTIGDRLGLATQHAQIALSMPNEPDHPPWEPDVFSISNQATVMSDVRAQGIVFASKVDGVPEGIDVENMRASSSVHASVALEVTEAFDGVIHLRRDGSANAVGASLLDENGNVVWSLEALEQSFLVFWNGMMQPGGTPIDVSWRFQPGKYTLEYGHSPQQVLGTLGPSAAMLWITPPGNSTLAGDLDRDGALTAFDVDLLSRAVQLRETRYSNYNIEVDRKFDLNDDKQFDAADRNFWIESIAKTYVGDATLDGEFDPTDLIHVLAAGQYNDEEVGNSGWAEGDWNGDGDFDPSDLIVALQAGGYNRGPRAALVTVPEPTMAPWLLMFTTFALRRRRGE